MATFGRKAVCPYDRNHRVPFEHFPAHLERRHGKDVEKRELMTCPNNRYHVVFARDFVSHVEMCPDGGRVTMWGGRYAQNGVDGGRK